MQIEIPDLDTMNEEDLDLRIARETVMERLRVHPVLETTANPARDIILHAPARSLISFLGPREEDEQRALLSFGLDIYTRLRKKKVRSWETRARDMGVMLYPGVMVEALKGLPKNHGMALLTHAFALRQAQILNAISEVIATDAPVDIFALEQRLEAMQEFYATLVRKCSMKF